MADKASLSKKTEKAEENLDVLYYKESKETGTVAGASDTRGPHEGGGILRVQTPHGWGEMARAHSSRQGQTEGFGLRADSVAGRKD